MKTFIWTTGMVTMFLLGVYLFKGYTLDDAITSSFVWGLISSAIFHAVRYYKMRKNQACALCEAYPPVTGGK